MSNENTRYWFVARHKAGGKMLHVISARSIGRARASLGRLSEAYVFEQLTWSELEGLTGFATVTTTAATTLASGHLLMQWQGKVVSLQVAD